MIIAVDFDGTIVEHQYPKIGKPIPDAIEVMKKLQQAGHKLILWTYRYGDTLEDAVEYCRQNGVDFYAVNASKPGESWKPGMSRLIEADLFIDDRNVFGLKPWSEIEQELLS
ncbi:hydrolase [bacterium SCSIO 12741]|nr:hydrolase [bacterium SCSIO 12741]